MSEPIEAPLPPRSPHGPRSLKDLDPVVAQVAADISEGLKTYMEIERPGMAIGQILRAFDVVYWMLVEEYLKRNNGDFNA